MNVHHWQWDGRQLPLSVWLGFDPSLVFGMRLVLKQSEASITDGSGTVWLGPMYFGISLGG